MGLSQKELGEAIGIERLQIFNYEAGKNRVSASSLFEIGFALQVGIEFFFEGLEGSPTNQSRFPPHELFMLDETISLISMYVQLPEKLRKSILALTRSMSMT